MLQDENPIEQSQDSIDQLPISIPLEDAFQEVIFTRGIYKKLGFNVKTVQSLRIQYRNKGVSAKKMREILVLAGYKLLQQEIWEAPVQIQPEI